MLTRPRIDAIAKALGEHFGETLRVEVSVSSDGPETPHQAESRLADESIEAARQSLENDPNVKAMKSLFGAELKPDSIEVITGRQSD
jgi:DNA polymerase-3 subunit gamma/tau